MDSGRGRLTTNHWPLATGHCLGHARECDGPYGFVHAIREQIKNGVDHIKLNLSGGVMGPFWDRHTHTFLLPEELEATFALCKQRDYKVMAHATNPDAVRAALRMGAHSVEHGYIMDESACNYSPSGIRGMCPRLESPTLLHPRRAQTANGGTSNGGQASRWTVDSSRGQLTTNH